MRDRPPPPPSLSIDLRAEEKFRNASLNRDAMQKKKEERKEKKKKLGHRFGLSFQPLLFNLTLSSLESVPLKDESRGDEDLGRRDRRGSLGWSPNRRHIFLSAFALHPPPPHSIILHRSFPRAPFLFSRIYSSVHERSRAFTELEHLPPRYYLY